MTELIEYREKLAKITAKSLENKTIAKGSYFRFQT